MLRNAELGESFMLRWITQGLDLDDVRAAWDYAEAMVSGRVPQELDAAGKAGEELKRLFMFVFEFVNMRGENVELQSYSATA
jgi:hypothetical protein